MEVNDTTTSYVTSSTDTEPGDDSEQQTRKKKKKKKINVDKVIASVIRAKSRDKVISRKIKDVVQGVDASTSAKQSFGQWMSTLMPYIDNNKFLVYATGIMNYTIRFVNASQAGQDAGFHPSMPLFPPTQQNHNSSQSQLDDDSTNLTTPPRQQTSSSQQRGSGRAKYESPTNMQPTNGHQVSSQQNTPPSLETYTGSQGSQSSQPAPPAYQKVMKNRRNQQSGHHAAVYGPNKQLLTTHQLVPGQAPPPYLPGNMGAGPSNVLAFENDGRVYSELQPALLSSVEALNNTPWHTPGPSPPRAIRQPSPSHDLDASLDTLAREVQKTASRLRRIKKEPKEPPTTVSKDDTDDHLSQSSIN